MKKKLLVFILIFFIESFFSLCFAKATKVTALQEFNSTNPPKYFRVRLSEDLEISETKTLYKYYTLNGYIYDVIPPKRLKRGASFVFVPTHYTDYSNKTYPMTNVVSQYTTNKFTLKNFTISSALSMAIGAVPAFVVTTGYYAFDGAKKNEEGNRFKSSATEVYENSCLSLGEKGDNLYIQKNQEFYLNFVIIEQQEPNYEYTKIN